MCRHLGYLGPTVSVGEMLTRGTHSLMTQSWAPRDMRCAAVVNADGYGAAWWPQDAAPARDHRCAMPIWSDPAVTGVLGEVRSSAVLAAVRSATVGMVVSAQACAPFVEGRWAFSHNGVVTGWPHSLAEVAAQVPAAQLLTLPAPTDSAALWTIVRHRLGIDDTGCATADPAAVLRALVAELDHRAPQSRLNLMLGDGHTLWATTVHHSLSTRHDGTSTVLASEPLDDDPTWTAVPDRSLVVATADTVAVTPL
ncbi:ergothioneine biosynthesis protein EgtC [Williamsia sp. CHRR-6]|uniref:ergothioneine biosynthesis protein EgtC n=1 Tax=Williamsia sp. CHRR-6 TaxID=2835871 RepID=UPI001BDAADB1|nr:ergothioneine biosynthesis protein EgtC [Williamsia sp. CHRR-6]MBT0567286.1 ergothioneine biosynthesis protein EgtC [Williamsia sp. CHRR-6]